MSIMDILGQAGAIQSMARELGVSESQAESGAAALIPAILGGFKKQAQAQPAGLQGLVGMLGGLGGGGLLDEVLAPRPTNATPGNDILAQIFGSKDVSRTVAGYMAKQGRASAAPRADGGGLGDVLGSVLGGGNQRAARGGETGLASMLDLNGDGNPLDDILGMAGQLMR